MKFLDVFEKRKEWDIIDSTKLTEFMRCPRRYFYSHIIGWRIDSPNIHLVFGEAWHAALEFLYQNNFSDESLSDSRWIFEAYYRRFFSPESDRDNGGKTPQNAMAALKEYSRRFVDEMEDYESLYTESAGTVLIANDTEMAFKIDLIRKNLVQDSYEILDHKTSGKRNAYWSSEYLLSIQMSLYLHVLYSIIGDASKVDGVRVRTAFLYKSQPNEFDEYLFRKDNAQMDSFITNLVTWNDSLKREMNLLLEHSDTNDRVMDSFPMNQTACFQYGKCPFLDYCVAWANPLTRCETTPSEFRVEFWNPLADHKIKNRFDLTKEDTNILR